jgi:hypothetical protein
LGFIITSLLQLRRDDSVAVPIEAGPSAGAGAGERGRD